MSGHHCGLVHKIIVYCGKDSPHEHYDSLLRDVTHKENQLLGGEVFHYTGKAGATRGILQAERFVRCDCVGLL